MLESIVETTLPYATAELPGIGGVLRAQTDHFVVEEIPLYEAQGEGQHLYVNITRAGLTTKEVENALVRLFDLRYEHVGYAGLKDKEARTTQTFSIDLGAHSGINAATVTERLEGELGVHVNWAKPHRNRLKIGHLLGNRFEIVVSAPHCAPPECLARCQRIAEQLVSHGLPNYFGPQRMGKNKVNVTQGLGILQGALRKQDKWLRQFLVSSVQSHLCNLYLAERVGMGGFERLLSGDIAKKYATGGMFDVVDLDSEQPRYAAHEISFTAPIYGPKMWAAKLDAGALEARILDESGLSVEDFARVRANGTRRLGRLLVNDLAIQQHPVGVLVTFSLTKGAYATTVLREFIKDGGALEGSESGAVDDEALDA